MKNTDPDGTEQWRSEAKTALDAFLTASNAPQSLSAHRRDVMVAALQYLSRGWSIIPVSGKQPEGKWRQFAKRRLSEPALLQRLLPEAVTGIAVVCGRLSNLLVIDFDGDVGHQAFEELRPLFSPNTPIVRTGSGGYHAYFVYEHGRRVQAFNWRDQRAGEIRGEGGNVVLPPSQHPNGSNYQWLSEPTNSITPPPIPTEVLNALTQIDASSTLDEPPAPATEVLRLLEAALHKVHQDGAGRNETGFWLACQLRDHGLPKETATPTMLTYQTDVAGVADHRYEPTEATASLEQAYSRPPRNPQITGDPWPIERIGSANPPDFPHHLLPDTVLPYALDLQRRMSVPFSFVALGMLITASAVLGRRLVMRPIRNDHDWEEALNLWGLIVANPGELKSPTIRQLTAPLFDIEKELAAKNREARLAYEAELQSRNKNDSPLDKPTPPREERLVVQDITVEKLAAIMADNPNGVVSIQDEMSALLNAWARSNHPAEEPFYLKAAAGTGSHVVDRIKRGTQIVENACLSLLGATQPEVLARFLTYQSNRGTGANGLIQRFLIVAPAPEPWRDNQSESNTEAQRQYRHVIRRLWDTPAKDLGGSPTIRLTTPTGEHHLPASLSNTPHLHFSPAAEKAFREWRTGLEARTRDQERSAAIRAFLGKARGLVPRIAAILHLLGDNKGDVPEPTLHTAIEWAELLEAHAETVYGSESTLGAGAKLLAERIRDGSLQQRFTNRPFSRRELSRLGWQGISTPETLDNTIEDLLEANWLIELPTKRKGSRIFTLHPTLT